MCVCVYIHEMESLSCIAVIRGMIGNYERLDPLLGYVGSLMRRLDAAIKHTKIYYAVGSQVVLCPYPRDGIY